MKLKIELHDIKKESNPMVMYLQKIKKVRDKLVVSVMIDDEELLHVILQGMRS